MIERGHPHTPHRRTHHCAVAATAPAACASSTYSKASGPFGPTALMRSRAASGLKAGFWQHVKNSPAMRLRRPSSVLGDRPLHSQPGEGSARHFAHPVFHSDGDRA